MADSSFGWDGLIAGGLEVQLIPAARGSIIDDAEGAGAVARALLRRLRRTG